MHQIKHDQLKKDILSMKGNTKSIELGPDPSIISINITLNDAQCADTFIYKNEFDRDEDFIICKEFLK